MNDWHALALTLAPELSGALFGPAATSTAQAVAAALEKATGTPDANAAQQVIARDPAIASQVRIALARIAADAGQEARRAELQTLAEGLQTPRDPARADPLPDGCLCQIWAPVLISGLVLLTFAVAIWAALTRTLPAGSETVVTMLLGTLAAMATGVVSYWVGSSAGSAIKTQLLYRSPPPLPGSTGQTRSAP